MSNNHHKEMVGNAHPTEDVVLCRGCGSDRGFVVKGPNHGHRGKVICKECGLDQEAEGRENLHRQDACATTSKTDY